MNDDPNLREQFASLRRAETESVPRFEQVIGRARRRANGSGWKVGIAACVLMVVTAGLILHLSHPSGSPTNRAAAPALADWRAPTDFLLDTPGRELLHTIPELGRHTSTGIEPLPHIGMTTPALRAGLEHS